MQHNGKSGAILELHPKNTTFLPTFSQPVKKHLANNLFIANGSLYLPTTLYNRYLDK